MANTLTLVAASVKGPSLRCSATLLCSINLKCADGVLLTVA